MTSIALYVIQYGTIGGCNAHEICFQLHKSSALWDMKNILVIDNVDMKNILVIVKVDMKNTQGDTPRRVAERMGNLGQLFDAVMPRGVMSHKE